MTLAKRTHSGSYPDFFFFFFFFIIILAGDIFTGSNRIAFLNNLSNLAYLCQMFCIVCAHRFSFCQFLMKVLALSQTQLFGQVIICGTNLTGNHYGTLPL